MYQKPKGKLDEVLEIINSYISRLLGKKSNKSNIPRLPKNHVSNLTFSVVLVLSLLLIWISSGLYYIANNQLGIMLYKGQVTQVEYGPKIGLTLPYPFSDVVILDGIKQEQIELNDGDNNQLEFLSKDLVPIGIEAEFSYEISNPKLLYTKYVQDPDTWDTQIHWVMQSELHNFIANLNVNQIKQESLNVVQDQLENRLAITLEAYGVKLNELNLSSIEALHVKNDITNKSESQAVLKDHLVESSDDGGLRAVIRERQLDGNRGASE